jgi:MSHA pilin protein MshD
MRRISHRHRGVTLVELVMFIVLMGIAFGALMLALSQLTRTSADPLASKQSLAIAEALLDEIELMPFTYCDPDDANASTATSTAGCATLVESSGPETGESRGSTTTPFDNVNDYHGYQMLSGILDASGAAVSGLTQYKVTNVTVSAADLGTITAASGNALRISVTVQAPDSSTLTLEGYRARYAPNTAQ